MTMHKSLRLGSGMIRHRNVYNRWERLLKLQEQGRWTEGSSPFGIPKVRTAVVKVGGKKKKAKAEAAEGDKAADAKGADAKKK